MAGQPPAEHPIDADLAQALLADQHPDLAGLPITAVAAGWDNAMFRLGEDLALRLPRRAAGAELTANELRWLPQLAAGLPLPVPAPLRAGAPGRGYPWAWSVTPWLSGIPAELSPLRADQAEAWGAFLRALHRPAPEAAPHNPNRSIPLVQRAVATGPLLERLSAEQPDLVGPEVLAKWRAALEAETDLAPTWIHGDLHGRNVLSDGGRLSGVIDWGDMARGDPAMDLYSLWMLLPDADARAAAISTYGGVSKATLARARGWAAGMGAVLLDAGGRGDPGLAGLGAATLRALVEGP